MLDQKQHEEIRSRIDHHNSAQQWEKHVSAALWLIYAAAIAVWIIADNVAAAPLFIMALALLIARIAVGRVELKRRKSVIKLIKKLNHEKAGPFYKELRDKFAEEPNIQITLEDDGTININDRRVKKLNEEGESK